MKLRLNKPLRDLGIYKLHEKTLILSKRSDELAFLFTPQNWRFYGPVEYRVSHGGVYCRGMATGLTDENLIDTGTASPPSTFFSNRNNVRFRSLWRAEERREPE
jgi:hypothetical protein